MNKPTVAIVGRPNVGKSSLFNMLVGMRLSIVAPTPGVTRDRVFADAEWQGREFTLIDTGGIEPTSSDNLLRQMRLQAEIAIEAADVIILMMDIQSGLTAADEDIARKLHRSGKPVVVAVNKIDQPGTPPATFYDFYKLGFSEVYAISASHKLGLSEVLDAIIQQLPEPIEDISTDDTIRVAVIGKPNTGKSSLVNQLLGEERVIVTPIAGTTRDATDTFIGNEYGNFILIDTAGLRRKGRVTDRIERYSVIRANQAIERADVCLIMLNAEEGVTEQDTKIAGLAWNLGKTCIFAVNKWDLIVDKDIVRKERNRQILTRFHFMAATPIIYISALTGLNCGKLWPLIRETYEAGGFRISTAQMNEFISDALIMHPPPQDKGKHLKIYYATQVGNYPVKIIFFVNDTRLTHFSYDRYLENRLRELYGFAGNPIQIIWRGRKEKDML
ncbi:MAG TPA: ribosome biogenesis GTPase Der [Clostridiaceae bacterium]|nr:ribosome biogenesis GTPase Der [Clostridiaceae bacterium]